MLFFVICALMALIVTAALLAPLLRGGAGDAAVASDVDVYRDQLAEVDRDLARGVLDPDEAERARTEIARRLLAADRAERAGRASPGAAPRGLTRVTAALTAAFVILGGGAIYAALGAVDPSGPYPDIPRAQRLAAAEAMRADRPAQAQAEAAAPPTRTRTEGASDDYLDMVARLREVVPSRPDELRGWQLLARHEAGLGNFRAAARAQERVVAIKGANVEAAELLRLADLLVAAAGGYVSPETEAVLEQVLDRDPRSLGARYYLGLLYAQTDRPDLAFELWREVVETAGPDDPHARMARARIEEVAFRSGVDYALPAAPGAGPGAADMDAAEDMSPEDRAQMIRGMVQSLSDRLARQGGPAADWARLVTAYAVLGETAQAEAILGEAREVFAGRPEDIAAIEAAADRAGLE